MNGSISTPETTPLPRVAIVGRPNVGKSTLFNRLAGSRRAITDPTPGVTRDPVEVRSRIAGVNVVLVDTGGYRSDGVEIDRLVTDRSIDSIEAADLVLLTVEVAGLTPEDEELVTVVRASASRTMLVVNKVDSEQLEAAAWNFHALGFSEVVHVSAEHNRHIDVLRRRIAALLEGVDAPKKGASDRRDDAIHIALLGKPNTGKSTLLNLLTSEERSIVSPVPGTTRDVVEGSFEYKRKRFNVLDTAGIRRKRMIRESVEYYSVNRAIGSIARSDVVLLVVDATEGISDQDKKIATQVIRRGKGIVLVFNKWDLVDAIANAEHAIRDRSRFVFPVLSFAPLVPTSAHAGTGVSKMLDAAIESWRQLQIEVATGPLNRAVGLWADQHPVPHGGGPRYAVRYMTQISSHPLRFVLFVNRTKGFPDSWLSYLRNRMREEFGMTQVPFTIELRES